MISDTFSYFPRYPNSRILYSSCLIFFVISLGALPLLKIEVSIVATAWIRPSSQPSLVHSPSAGRIEESYITENRKVETGDLLFIIASEVLDEQERFYKERIAVKAGLITDVRQAIMLESIAIDQDTPLHFRTDFYLQNFLKHKNKLTEAERRLRKAKGDFYRQEKLYKEMVIAAAEFENYQFEVEKCQDDVAQVRLTQHTQWQNELADLLQEQSNLESQLLRTVREKSTYIIKSPIKGTIQASMGTYKGTVVLPNQELAQISPDTSLIVIAFVSSHNIGTVQNGMSVRYEIDTYPYSQWGTIGGTVLEMPQDIKINDNKPIFEVRCSLDKDFLELKSGYRGFLKKGMSAKAHFIVAKRSLWQLLFDKTNDWLNPHSPS